MLWTGIDAMTEFAIAISLVIPVPAAPALDDSATDEKNDGHRFASAFNGSGDAIVRSKREIA